jgi:hypothetical protein
VSNELRSVGGNLCDVQSEIQKTISGKCTPDVVRCLLPHTLSLQGLSSFETLRRSLVALGLGERKTT